MAAIFPACSAPPEGLFMVVESWKTPTTHHVWIHDCCIRVWRCACVPFWCRFLSRATRTTSVLLSSASSPSRSSPQWPARDVHRAKKQPQQPNGKSQGEKQTKKPSNNKTHAGGGKATVRQDRRNSSSEWTQAEQENWTAGKQESKERERKGENDYRMQYLKI